MSLEVPCFGIRAGKLALMEVRERRLLVRSSGSGVRVERDLTEILCLPSEKLCYDF